MNCIVSHSRVDEGVAVWSYRINRLLVADDSVLLASSQQSLQNALDRFSAAYDRAGMKSTLKIPRYYVSLQTQGSVCCK